MSGNDFEKGLRFKTCVIRSDVRQICLPRLAIVRELQKCRYREEDIFALKLAIEEAIANAVKHGNQGDSSKTVTVRFAITPERSVIIVRDEGGGFHPDEVPDPTLPERLPLPNGRGIMLMRAYMDEVSYRDQGREVVFVKRCTVAATSL